ncbi:MAG: acetyl-CoA hydrolase [Pseudomonadales bacterium]|nr:acetyl-CoA hydrolase [Pseudomonadales bacterium]
MRTAKLTQTQGQDQKHPQCRSFSDVEQCVDAIIAKVGKDITFGMPLGLGKPIHLVNALYRRAKQDNSIKLHIATALTLEKPSGSSPLEKKFLGPFAQRLFGDIPDIEYMQDLRRNALPPNIQVSEFFFKAGSFLNNKSQQQNYISTNYTHAVRDLVRNGVNVVAQMVAKKEVDGRVVYSLSCNPDTGLDIVPALRKLEQQGKKIAVVGEVNNQLPFLGNHAQVEADEFDFMVDNKAYDCKLFAAPNMAISPFDHFIGFNASTLVKDDGTLQVGIGSLGSALVNATLMREQKNDDYVQLVDELQLREKFPVVDEIGGVGQFSKGLYGCSEMMVDGFVYLFKAGILKKQVFDDLNLQSLMNAEKITTQVDLSMLDTLVENEVISDRLHLKDVKYLKKWGIFKDSVEFKGGSLIAGTEIIGSDLNDGENRQRIKKFCLGESLTGGIVMHGGFFLGPQQFYDILHDLSEAEKAKICMTSVNYINHLYDHPLGDQKIKVAQRKHARFINSTMMYTLGGAAVSDGLANGKVVSGVGGQYNFVAMAHEIDDARSILKLKSTRQSGGKTLSNIVFSYGHTTIPRHLRDIVVTEYGIADLLGKPDKDVYIELIKIADSRFQDELLSQAKSAGKVPADYVLPEAYRQNTPERLMSILQKYRAKGDFEPFPFGCDFTDDELKLGKALKALKARTATRAGLIKAIWSALRVREIPLQAMPLLKRMDMEHASDFKAKLEVKLLVAELLNQGAIEA